MGRTSDGRGRPRDPAADRRILEATRGLVARDGYARLSMEGVARAAGVGKQTLYRRWPRKPLLVFDAVFGGAQAVVDVLPDTGSLAGDLAAVTRVQAEVYRRPGVLELVRGLVADCLADPALLEELRRRFLAPRLSALATVVERARQRGEVAAVDPRVVAETVAGTMLAHHLLFAERPDAGFGERLAALVAGGAS